MKKLSISLLATLFFLSHDADAYLSVVDTGEIISSGDYRGFLELQNTTSGPSSGVNLLGSFDLGVSESSNLRFHLGVGAVNFDVGTSYKWVPIPDYKDQPAIGLRGGISYARADKKNILNFTFTPIASKIFEVGFGAINPYAALPLTSSNSEGENKFPVHLAVGSEFKFNELKGFSLFLEFGGNLSNATNYMSLAASMGLEDFKALRK